MLKSKTRRKTVQYSIQLTAKLCSKVLQNEHGNALWPTSDNELTEETQFY